MQMPEVVIALQDRVLARAEADQGIAAVAMVGSYARGTPSIASDVDFVVIVDDPARYVADPSAFSDPPLGEHIATRHWGHLTELRHRTPQGLEVDLGVVGPAWANTDPVDDGTARVVRDGIEVLYDPAGVLAAVVAAVAR